MIKIERYYQKTLQRRVKRKSGGGVTQVIAVYSRTNGNGYPYCVGKINV